MLFTFFSTTFDQYFKPGMMKAIALKITILFVAVIATIGVNAQDFNVKPGDVLTYHVKTDTKEYDFTVTLKTWKPDLTFDWVMTGSVNKKGAIGFGNADASDAMALNNFFTAGAVTLKGQTSIWASNKLYKLIKSNVAAKVVFDNEATADELLNKGTANTVVTVNGSASTFTYLRAASDTKQLWILDNAKNPLILRMYMPTWRIELTGVKQQ